MDIGKAKAIVKRADRRKRVGRGTGSRRGKMSGRGRDGAKSRSGWSSRGMTGGSIPLWRRLPKRGFSNAPFKKEYSVVNVATLNRFDAGATVTPEDLESLGLLKQPARSGVKVLGDGDLEKALTVRAHAFSKSAVAKIEGAGGAVEVIPPPKPSVRNKMRSRTPAIEI
jgi:large subunit ribosomal protein L15